MPPMQPFDFSSGPQVLRSATRRILENTGNYIQQDNVIEEERQILTRDASSITVRIYTPRNSQTGGGPLLIMYHAGGYCAGDIGDEGTNCRNFATIFGGIAISVGYRLAPEFPFPVPVNDAYDALKWVRLSALPSAQAGH
jgi:acetyl esterase/lipase